MLTLYYRPLCPYCIKVLTFAESNGISFDLRDIDSSKAVTDELIALGGKRQVPYLVDTANNVSLYESDDIITYLTQTYGDKDGVR